MNSTFTLSPLRHQIGASAPDDDDATSASSTSISKDAQFEIKSNNSKPSTEDQSSVEITPEDEASLDQLI